MKFIVLLFIGLAIYAPSLAQERPWTEFESIGFDRYADPLVKVGVDGKQYYYHLHSGVLADDMGNRAGGMTVVMKDGRYGVIRDDGKLIVPFEYDEIRLETDYYGQWYPGIAYNYRFIKLRKDSQYGLADAEGRIIVPTQFAEIDVVSKHIIGFKEGGLWGWIDAQSGLVAQPALYDEIRRFSQDEYASVVTGDKRGLAAKDGTVVIPVEHRGFLGYVQASDRVFVWGNRVGDEGHSGVLYDLDGNVRLVGFSKVGTMRHADFITFEKEGLTGAVNPLTGDIVIDPIYDRIEDGVRGRFIVRKDGLYGVLDEQGKTIVPALYAQLDLINVDNQTKASAMPRIDGAAGEPPSQDEWQTKLRNYRDFMDSQAYFIRVDSSNGQGLFDWQGMRLASPDEYDAVRLTFHKSPYVIARERESKHHAIIDSAGNLVDVLPYALPSGYGYNDAAIELDWEVANRFVAFAQPSADDIYGEEIGLYDLEGRKMALPVAAQRIEWLTADHFKARSVEDDEISLYTGDGTLVLSINAPVEDLLVVGPDHVLLRDAQGYRLVGMDGNTRYENPNWGARYGYMAQLFPQLKGMRSAVFHQGLMKLYMNEGNLFVNEQGEEVRFEGYAAVDDFYTDHALAAVALADDTGYGRKAYRYGLIDRAGHEIHPMEWESVSEFPGNPNWYQVMKDGKQGLADRNGKYVLEPIYDEIGNLGDAQNFEIKKDGKVGLAARDGRIILEPRFERIHRNYEGKDRTWPLIAQEGDEFVVLEENGQYLPVRAQRYTY